MSCLEGGVRGRYGHQRAPGCPRATGVCRSHVAAAARHNQIGGGGGERRRPRAIATASLSLSVSPHPLQLTAAAPEAAATARMAARMQEANFMASGEREKKVAFRLREVLYIGNYTNTTLPNGHSLSPPITAAPLPPLQKSTGQCMNESCCCCCTCTKRMLKKRKRKKRQKKTLPPARSPPLFLSHRPGGGGAAGWLAGDAFLYRWKKS